MLHLLLRLKEFYGHHPTIIRCVKDLQIGQLFYKRDDMHGEVYMVIYDPFKPEDKEVPDSVIAVALNSSYVCEFEPNTLVAYLPHSYKNFR